MGHLEHVIAAIELSRFESAELGLDEPPAELYPSHPWARYTPTEAYRDGARLFAGLAFLFGGAYRLRAAMADWYRANAAGWSPPTGWLLI